MFHGNNFFLFYFYFFFYGRQHRNQLIQIPTPQGNRDWETDWRLEGLEGVWTVSAHSTILPGWIPGPEGNRDSWPFLICPCSPAPHLMGFCMAFQLLSHQQQSGRLQFLKTHLTPSSPYLRATTLNLSFTSWAFCLVSLLCVWVSFGESYSLLPEPCFKITIWSTACCPLRIKFQLLFIQCEAFYTLICFSLRFWAS